jgi:hypothetical protein
MPENSVSHQPIYSSIPSAQAERDAVAMSPSSAAKILDRTSAWVKLGD